MLELKTKWFTNSLAKQSILNKDFILCHDGSRLFIVGYGAITSGGKNTYNYEVKDNEKNVVLSSGENAYLDALTKIVLGSSPKSKANKDANETKPKEAKQESKKVNKDSLLLTFDEAFEQACKSLQSYKQVATMLGTYNGDEAIKITMLILQQAKENEQKRLKELKKSEELKSLYQTLELAKAQGNNMLIEAIKDMITKKEQE